MAGRALTFRRILAAIGILTALLYAGAVAYLASQETRLVFKNGRPLAPERPPAPFEQVDIPRGNGARQFAWVMPAPEQVEQNLWLLYLHGNNATVASRTNLLRYEGFRAVGLNVLAAEYRGFGGLEGTPSERVLGEDARAAYDYLRNTLQVSSDRIVIFGWSLGSAVAVNLAAEVPSAAVILEGAPASLVAIGQRDYPWMPVRMVMRNPFESILKVGRIDAPILFLHSPEDEIIPIDEGRRLFEAAGEPKRFVELSGGHIRPAEADREQYFASVALFLATRHLMYEARETLRIAPDVKGRPTADAASSRRRTW